MKMFINMTAVFCYFNTQYIIMNKIVSKYQQTFNNNRSHIQIQMDYELLYSILPKEPLRWSPQDIDVWLNYINLQTLSEKFRNAHIDGSCLQSLQIEDLQNQLSIKSSITKKKLCKWIKGGLADYTLFVEKKKLQKKSNQMSGEVAFKRIQTSMMRQRIKPNSKQQLKEPQVANNTCEKKYLMISPFEGQNASLFCVSDKGCHIGKAKQNQIPVFEQTAQFSHAEILHLDNEYYLIDLGSVFGTYVKIKQKQILSVGMIIQMGSYQFEIININSNTLSALVVHCDDKSKSEPLTITLDKNGKNSFAIGRKNSNQLFLDDHHLSSIHAKISILNSQFIIEDMSSTNGTWIRLSKSSQKSSPFLLQNKSVFKIGCTSTYICRLNFKFQPMEIQKQSQKCLVCNEKQNDGLLHPCKHNISCFECSSKIKCCPICKIQVESYIKIFI